MSMIHTPSGPRPAQELKPGDKVCGAFGGVNTVVEAEPQPLRARPKHKRWYLVNGKYCLAPYQSIFSGRNVTHAYLLKPGDTIYDELGRPVLVRTVTRVREPQPWVKLNLDGDHSYLADGLRLHNADRYLITGGGSVNWNDNNSWSASDGGATGASFPVAGDNTFLTAASGAGTLTVNVTSACANFDCTGYTGTLAGSGALSVSGNFTLVAGMTRSWTGTLTFNGTASGKTITMNGKTLANLVTINGAGGAWTLQDAFDAGGTLAITQGTLDTNGQTVTVFAFDSIGTGTRTLTLGASTVNLSGATPINFSGSNFTFNENTSTINCSSASATINGNGETFATVNLTSTSAGTRTINGANTFGTLAITNGAVATNNIVFGANQTITTMSGNGNSASNRPLYRSDTVGTARTLTVTTWTTPTDVDFRDITGAGAASPFAGTRLGDCKGNSGITFTAAANKYWVGNTANWNATVWATSSGGGAAANNFPLAQDTCIFDANSFSANGQTASQNVVDNRVGSILCSGTDQTFNLAFNSSLTVFGDVTFDANTTISNGFPATFSGRNTQTLTSAGKSWGAGSPTIDSLGGTVLLADAVTINSDRLLTLTRDTFNMNNKAVSVGLFASSNSNTRSITSGGATLTLTGNAGGIWLMSTATNFALNDALQVDCTYSGATGTRTIQHGNTAGDTEANSPNIKVSAGTDIFVVTPGGGVGNLDFTGFSGTWSDSTMTVYGSLTQSTGMTVSGVGSNLTFAATSGTKTITSNGKSMDKSLILNGVGGTWQLADELTLGSTRTLTLTNGHFNMNNKAVSTGLFASSNANTRSITSGGATLTLTGNGGNLWSVGDATNFTLNDALQLDATYSGSVGTRSFPHGTAAGGTASNSPNLKVSAGSDTVTLAAGGKIGNLDFTGFSGTLGNNSQTVYGSLTLSAGMTVNAGTGSTSFEATSGTKTITTNGKTLDFPVSFNGAGGTWQLADALTLGSTRTLSLDRGTFNMNGQAVSTGLFQSSNGNTRTLTSGGATMTLTGNNATIWNVATVSGFSLSGALQVVSNYSGAVGTRTLNTGAVSAANAASISISGGTDTVVLVTNWKNVDFTGFAGTLSNGVRVIFGNLILATGMTLTVGASDTNFLGSGAKTITSNGKTMDFPVMFNETGGAWQLADALTVGATRTTTLLRGTIDVNGKTFSTGRFSSSNSNVRGVTFGSGGKIVTTDTAAATVFDCATATNLTITRTGGAIEIGGNTTSTRTFAGGDQTWPSVTFTNTTANGRLNFTGSNTLKSLAVSVAPQNIGFTAGTTTTIEDRNGFPSGTVGNLVTIGSITAANHNLVKSGAGTIGSQYLSISRSQASPANKWYAGVTSTDGGNNSGWLFANAPTFHTGMMGVFRP